MIIKTDFLYTPVGKNRMLHIYLPDDYERSEERYPVMYFFDGHNLYNDEDATYGKSWGMKNFLEGWSKDMIIVGMECSHEGEARLSEYLPYPAIGRFGQFNPMGEQTMDWIVEEVKPYIDKTYRTWPFRECTGIAGSSMGGLMSLYAAVHYNRWFSKAGCVSSALSCCMEPLMADMQANPMDPDTRVYLSWGTKEAYGLDDVTKDDTTSDTYKRNRQVADKALEDGARVKLFCQVEGGHCEADWEKLVPGFMNFLWTEN